MIVFVATASNADALWGFTPLQLSALLGALLPLLVGLVTQKVTSPGLKAVLLAALAAIAGVVPELAAPNFHWQQALFDAVLAFIVGAGAHFGFYSKVKIGSKTITNHLQDVGAPRHRARAA